MKILFYPQKPKKPSSKMKKIVEYAKLKITCNPGDSYDRVVYWSYHKTSKEPDKALKELMQHYRIINIGGLDITKSRVEQVQKEIFGYNAIIDPFTYEGEMVEKAEMQCGHRLHRVVTNIDVPKDGYIYCRLLDNRLDDYNCVYYRYFIYGDKITHTNITTVPIENRLKGGMSGKIETVRGCEGITPEEQAKIIEYTRSYRTEITELDVIRDRDQRIYVTDNNNVPGGLKHKDYAPFYQEWAECLTEFLYKWDNDQKIKKGNE